MDRRAFIRAGACATISAAGLSALAVPEGQGQNTPVSLGDEPSHGTPSPAPSSPGGRVVPYGYPRLCPRSASFKVRAGGQEVFVYHTSAGDFAAFGCQGSVLIQIEVPRAAQSVRIAPARHGNLYCKQARGITFR